MNVRSPLARSIRSRGFATIGSGLGRVLAPFLMILLLATALAPLLTPRDAAASTCPPGYVAGPPKVVDNGNGTSTWTPGDCILPDPDDLSDWDPYYGQDEAPQFQVDTTGNGLSLLDSVTPQAQPNAPPVNEADEEPVEDQTISGVATVEPADPEFEIAEDDPTISDVATVEPEEDRTEREVDRTGAGIFIQKYVCPDGFTAANANHQVLLGSCPAGAGGWTFTTTDAADPSLTLTAATGIAGDVSFMDLGGHDYWVTEAPATGWGDPVVYCAASPLDGLDIAYAETPLIDRGTVQLSFVPELELPIYCDWFNVPANEPGTESGDQPGDVVISKFVCPVGYDAESVDVYALALDCNAPLAGIEFSVNDGNEYLDWGTTGPDGVLAFDQMPFGPFGVAEYHPDAYEKAVAYCTTYELGDGGPIVTGPTKMTVKDKVTRQTFTTTLEEGQTLNCSWYNTPTADSPADEPGDITITKLVCPAGYNAENADIYELSYDCNAPLAGVEFGVSDGGQYIAQQTTGDDGIVEFDQIPFGPISIVEQVPDGYGTPVVYCTTYLLTDSGPVVEGPFKVTVDAGNQIFHIFEEGQTLNCTWYNIPYEEYEDGSITIIKYTCPPGYDHTASGANPEAECWDLTDGVTFSAQGQNGPLAPVVTGESGAGTAVFADLAPGPYTVTEQVPTGTKTVFVLDCTGSSVPFIQSYPLSIGASLDVIVGSGDDIICRWYNIPEHEERGDIDLTKYVCATVTFTSIDSCQRYEGGQGFRLTGITGPGAGSSLDGTTDTTGRYLWAGLLPGTYEIDELGGEWCHASADYTDAGGYLVVAAGVTTHIDVYNCGVTPPTKQPVKYPNTGAGPAAANASSAAAPVSPANAPVAEATRPEIDLRLPALRRGERPVSIEIESADVDAAIETLEVVDGAMQSPTGATDVAWYKDTAALGVSGNVIMAGHLNYWGVPEGVFYALETVEEGDEIVVNGESGAEYRYEIVSVGQEDALAAPAAEILDPAGDATLTLITCGGEWDAARGEYLSRTVVQADLIVA